MTDTTEIDWTQNCMTVWIHNGRPALAYSMSLSELDLADSSIREMVEQAIKWDAQQFVDHSVYTQEFADLICELWEQYFDKALADARENGERYQKELKDVEARYGEDRAKRFAERRANETNSSWNDHVTYICRVCGSNASRQAESTLTSEGKSIKTEVIFEITPETTIWYPGPDYVGRQGRYAKPASEVSWNMLFALVQKRAEEDGEWAIENNRVGGRPEFMRKMMKWVSDSENIVQCLEANRDQNPTVDWICRELANTTKGIAGGAARG